jgi:hypothetical protein
MPKHLVMRRTTLWCSALIAFFLLLSGALVLVISPTARADPDHSPDATLTSDKPADRSTAVPSAPSGDGGQLSVIITVPPLEVPAVPLPTVTIPEFQIPGLQIPGFPVPGSPSGTPTPGPSSSPTPASPSPKVSAEPGNTETVRSPAPLSDPPAESSPAPVARNCLVGGSGDGCAGAEVARDLSPAGLLVLGSVALLGSGAFLESLRGGSRG